MSIASGSSAVDACPRQWNVVKTLVEIRGEWVLFCSRGSRYQPRGCYPSRTFSRRAVSARMTVLYCPAGGRSSTIVIGPSINVMKPRAPGSRAPVGQVGKTGEGVREPRAECPRERRARRGEGLSVQTPGRGTGGHSPRRYLRNFFF